MHDNPVAYAAHGKGKGKDMRQVQCYSYKKYKHIVVNCIKKSCNYYKKPRHIIKECLDQANQAIFAHQVVVGSTTIDKSVFTLKNGSINDC